MLEQLKAYNNNKWELKWYESKLYKVQPYNAIEYLFLNILLWQLMNQLVSLTEQNLTAHMLLATRSQTSYCKYF